MQLGAEVRNGRGADKCIQRADECRKVHTSAYSVHTKSGVVYTL